MNKQDLKNGMKFISRDGEIKYIIENNIYRKECGNKLELEYSLGTLKRCFKEDMSYESNAKFDIMRVLDLEDNLIWKREEVDWAKVPADTKVLVRNSKDGEWCKRYFSEYKDGRFYTFDMGGTSWSTSDKTFWRECKLVEPEQKEYTFDEVECLFKEYCNKFDNCNKCDYSGDCKDSWKNDNFTITRK